jgi:transaldolase
MISCARCLPYNSFSIEHPDSAIYDVSAAGQKILLAAGRIFRRGRWTMELYLDTVSAGSIRKLQELIRIDGIMVRTDAMVQSRMSIADMKNDVISQLDTEQKLFAEILPDRAEHMIMDALHIYSLCPNAYAVIPATAEGLKAIRICSSRGLKVMAGNIYTAEQGYLAACSGAAFLDARADCEEAFGEGIQEISALVKILQTSHLPAQVAAHGIRSRRQFGLLAAVGVNGAAVQPQLAEQMILNPMTLIDAEKARDCWSRAFAGRTLL